MTKSSEDPKAGVSVDIHISYLKGEFFFQNLFCSLYFKIKSKTFYEAAREGDVVEIDARTVKMGRKLAFLECELKHKKDGSIIAKGTQTKYIGHI